MLRAILFLMPLLCPIGEQLWEKLKETTSVLSSNSLEEAGQDSRRVGSPSHLSPPTYLDNFQIILKTYEFGLRFKERTEGRKRNEDVALLVRFRLSFYMIRDLLKRI